MHRWALGLIGLVIPVTGLLRPAKAEVVLVRDGQPAATVVVSKKADAPSSGRRKRGRRPQWTDRAAAEVLVEWIQAMSGATLPIASEPPQDGAAVLVGQSALGAGLKLDDIASPTREGLRVRGDGRARILLAGQSPAATVKAACVLLERLGCRYYGDHPLGRHVPRRKTISLGEFTVTAKPGLRYRRIWGSQWSGDTLWKIWNGHGGTPMATGHSWGAYISKAQRAEHPEWTALRGGRRTGSDWYCTSNLKLRAAFAAGVLAAIESGRTHPSLSPPDGRGYCECPACRARDDPAHREPSTGTVCVSNRYLDFLDDVARRVAKKSPESILSFYAYADYTQAPTPGWSTAGRKRASDNLCAWIAPIRYSRYHRIGSPNSPSRRQLQQVIDGWAKVVGKIAYRTYNYNLAECTVPFSKIGIWTHDIPYLAKHGCIGINNETLDNWEIYGPHIYLSIRLAYDPRADADAILADYWKGFYGPAAKQMEAYWLAIDKAFAGLKCETGSFYPLHLVYTDAFLKRLRGLLADAAKAVAGDKTLAARVEMTRQGFLNAEQYIQVRNAMNAGDFARAKKIYDVLYARNEAENKKGLGNHYTVNYLRRFVGKHVEAGAKAVAAPSKLVRVLPDRCRMACDEADQGQARGYAKADFDDSSWKTVATYSNPLQAQGLPDRKTVLWYRTTFQAPPPGEGKRLVLFFTEVDGPADVYVNGTAAAKDQKKRTPFDVDVTAACRGGRNMLAVRVDHRKITELFLGGIIRPILLIQRRVK